MGSGYGAILEIRGLNPVIEFFLFAINCIWRDKNTVKEAANGPILKYWTIQTTGVERFTIRLERINDFVNF